MLARRAAGSVTLGRVDAAMEHRLVAGVRAGVHAGGQAVAWVLI